MYNVLRKLKELEKKEEKIIEQSEAILAYEQVTNQITELIKSNAWGCSFVQQQNNSVFEGKNMKLLVPETIRSWTDIKKKLQKQAVTASNLIELIRSATEVRDDNIMLTTWEKTFKQRLDALFGAFVCIYRSLLKNDVSQA